MKVLYLFNGIRKGLVEKVRAGDNPGDGFWGMLRLPHYGIQADYAELESSFPPRVAAFLRRHLNIYFVHLPLFFQFFKYDIIFTSTAFGSQLIRTLLPFRKPLWVMHDFSITGLLGDGRTLKQKVFHFMVTRAAGIVTVGKGETELLKQRFPHLKDRIEYITFGADTTFFKPYEGEKQMRIFGAGFDPDRDWETLVSACEGVDLPLVMATRPERVVKLQPLPAYAEQRMLTVPELARMYAESAIFVLPLDTSTGLNDAMGCSTLFEAMASGCAIIATRTHTIESYITDGENGLLVPEGDIDAMRLAIRRLLEDKELRERLGKNARTYAVEHLDAEKLTEKLAAFFRRLMPESDRVYKELRK